ncbi:MAG TPA: sigma-70 family RNA polymerase sigma factor [Terriglobales bacterium]|nr:sigma-70 family RNA polymerase sigma factor [Terriglobales bacterium]
MSMTLSPEMTASAEPDAGATPIGTPIDVALNIRAAQAGDHTAFELLVRQHEAMVLRLVRGLARQPDEAWDLYQETFTKLFTTLPRFRFECAFSTWVYRVATNAGLDYLRRQRVRRGLWFQYPGAADAAPPQVVDPSAGADPERTLLNHELQKRINGALAKLPARQRLVFELRHFQGLKLALIAEILHTTEATAKNALFRATRRLRVELDDLESGDAS